MPPLTPAFVITVNEGDALEYELTLQDEDGLALPLASLTTLTLTLSDEATATIINSRSAQDVKNANGGTYHATSGLFTMILGTADSPIVGTTTVRELQPEMHRALLEAVWVSASVSRTKRWEVLIRVINLGKTGTALAPLQDNALLTLEELRAALGLTQGEQDARLAEFINVCADTLESQTGRRLKSRPYTNEYTYVRTDTVLGCEWLDVEWPVTALSALEYGGSAQTLWMPGDVGSPEDFDVFVLEARDPKHGRDRLFRRGGWTGGTLVKRTYTGGYGVVGPPAFPIPGDLKEAIRALAIDWYHLRSRQADPVISRSSQGETITYVNEALPRRFKSLIQSYRRWSG